MRAGRRLALVSPPTLEKHVLLEGAAGEVGLNDFGDRWFERPFEVLLESIRSEARLNAAGEWAATATSWT